MEGDCDTVRLLESAHGNANEVLQFVASPLGDTMAVVVETYISGGFDGDTSRYEGVLGGRPVTPAISRRLNSHPVQCGAMRIPRLPGALLLVAATLAGCAAEKQWMKVGEPYTTAEFRRDYAECSKTKDGQLDDECMRSRGWVDMKPSKGDRTTDTPAPGQDRRYKGGR